MENFKVRLLGENCNGDYVHYEIMKNGKRFVNGWYKKYEYHCYVQLTQGEIVEQIEHLYSFLNTVL
jgi:hypothetical protein